MEKKPVYGMNNYGEERELAKASFKYIDRDITEIKTNFIRLGFHLAECRDMEYYKDFGFDNFYEFVEKNWGKDKTATSRHINIFMKFSAVSEEYPNNHKMWLDDKYTEYSYSQLSEMLQMNDKQMKQIKPDMSVKAIRELKKSWREENKSCDVATKKNADVLETEYEEIPKEPEVSGDSCDFDDTYVCQITDIICKHFYPEGSIDECAGCCIKCQKKGKCEYICAYACSRKEIVETVEQQDEKKELPILKNMEEREKFVLGFKEWNIWCRNELTEEIYYRYDLPDGAAIVIRSYPVYLEWKKEELEGKDLFLLKPEYKHFKNCETNMTEIKNYLKDLQKK